MGEGKRRAMRRDEFERILKALQLRHFPSEGSA
jgi:hypothetical protein